MKETYKKGSAAVWGIVVVVAAIITLAIVFLTGKKPANEVALPVATTTPVDTTTGIATTTVPDKKFVYKNGTYTSEGGYTSPGGSEQIKVTLTLKDDVVTDATVVPEATRPQSVHYQAIFVANYKQFVVGKNIADIKLDRVSGSSLTPEGFNDALTKIELQAKA